MTFVQKIRTYNVDEIDCRLSIIDDFRLNLKVYDFFTSSFHLFIEEKLRLIVSIKISSSGFPRYLR